MTLVKPVKELEVINVHLAMIRMQFYQKVYALMNAQMEHLKMEVFVLLVQTNAVPVKAVIQQLTVSLANQARVSETTIVTLA